MHRVAVILPAAGRGTRLGGPVAKAFVPLHGVPLWERCVRRFAGREDVIRTVLVLSDGELDRFRDEHAGLLERFRVHTVAGGAERCDSVRCGLAACGDAELVAVHDVARPLVTDAAIDAVFAAAAEHGAALLAAPVADTLKRADDGFAAETVPRAGLWAAQTPQVARRDLLERAFAERDDFAATDEAALLERVGVRPRLVPGPRRNFKITTADDLALARAVLAADRVDSGDGGTH